mmetsp:Transcript_25150/g.45957  ORF Transcript_25150/g.45957 Transcript_25150/m.45957 type:complete len:105 (+) Transcript_25150:60-374(+)
MVDCSTVREPGLDLHHQRMDRGWDNNMGPGAMFGPGPICGPWPTNGPGTGSASPRGCIAPDFVGTPQLKQILKFVKKFQPCWLTAWIYNHTHFEQQALEKGSKV